jgi:predicted ArsR family transcriptional regulator
VTTTLRITQRERQAAQAFRAGDTINEIAAVLGTTAEQANEWLDSPRLAEVCLAMRQHDRPKRGRPRKIKQ